MGSVNPATTATCTAAVEARRPAGWGALGQFGSAERVGSVHEYFDSERPFESLPRVAQELTYHTDVVTINGDRSSHYVALTATRIDAPKERLLIAATDAAQVGAMLIRAAARAGESVT